MAASTANAVADYLLCVAREHGDYLTPLKIQKLVFYADAWFMALHNEELVPESFEAWVHGPVLRSLYARFQGYRWNPVLEEVECPSLGEKVESFLKELYAEFGRFTGHELEQLTHQEDPWLRARGSLAPHESCSNLIDKQLTQSFYRHMAVET